MSDTIQIGLALSGGTAKCVAHIGVLRALEDAGIEIVHIAGTSGGSIIAANYAAGVSLDVLVEQAKGTKLFDLGGLGLFKRLGFFSPEKLHTLIAQNIGDITFDELRVPLAIVLTNLMTGSREVVEQGQVARVAQASCCIPQIYTPVELNGSLYVDGGLVEYLPLGALADRGLPLLVGVNLGFVRESRRPRHLIALIMQTMGIVAQQNAAVSEQFADVVIRPDLRAFNPFEIKEAAAMIDVGYEATQACIPAIREAWEHRHAATVSEHDADSDGSKSRLFDWWDRLRRRPRATDPA